MTQKVPASQTVEGVTAAQVASKLTGDTVQVVNTQTGAVATGTTIIPRDDTIPQITEGDQYMTLAITPTNAANLLDIQAVVQASCTVTTDIVAALFQDANVNALAVNSSYATTAQGVVQVCLRYRMTAGTTSATTFRVRVGPITAGTVTFNGAAGGRYYGGAFVSSITITEIKA